MKRKTFALPAILILAAIIATTSTSAAIVRDDGPSAFGVGQFRYRDPQSARTELWSFSFEAIANKNGHARGRAHFENLFTQTHVVVRINCLSVFSGINRSAVIMGRVLHSDNPSLPQSTMVRFEANDGPWPPIFSTDTITPLFEFPFPEEDCGNPIILTILPVENGDISIQL